MAPRGGPLLCALCLLGARSRLNPACAGWRTVCFNTPGGCRRAAGAREARPTAAGWRQPPAQLDLQLAARPASEQSHAGQAVESRPPTDPAALGPQGHRGAAGGIPPLPKKNHSRCSRHRRRRHRPCMQASSLAPPPRRAEFTIARPALPTSPINAPHVRWPRAGCVCAAGCAAAQAAGPRACPSTARRPPPARPHLQARRATRRRTTTSAPPAAGRAKPWRPGGWGGGAGCSAAQPWPRLGWLPLRLPTWQSNWTALRSPSRLAARRTCLPTCAPARNGEMV